MAPSRNTRDRSSRGDIPYDRPTREGARYFNRRYRGLTSLEVMCMFKKHKRSFRGIEQLIITV